MSEALYGYCPKCGAKGDTRERRPGGNDSCERGHIYPSRSAVLHPIADRYDAIAEMLKGRKDRWLEAYYFSFDPTGDEDIDLILAAVAFAGKGSHHTESWTDGEDYHSPADGGPTLSAIEVIQATAQRSANRSAELEARIAELERERDGLGTAVHDLEAQLEHATARADVAERRAMIAEAGGTDD